MGRYQAAGQDRMDRPQTAYHQQSTGSRFRAGTSFNVGYGMRRCGLLYSISDDEKPDLIWYNSIYESDIIAT
jgi:hypothetical protein